MSDQSGSWQPDPFGRHQYRYWDGTSWSDQVSDDGVVSSDPATAAGAAAAGVPTEPEPTQATTGWGTPPPDATTSMPAAGGAGAFPPPAFAATTPTEPAKPSSGNKLPLILGGVAILALIGVAAFLLLGGDDDGPSRAELISELQESANLTETEAACVVDAVGDGRMADLSEDPDSASAADRDALSSAISECTGAGEETTDTTEDTTEDTTDDTSSGVDDPMLAGFIEGLMSTTSLSEEQARCVGEQFLDIEGLDFEALAEDPNAMLADPQILSALMTILQDCDIDASSLGGGTSSGLLPGDTYGDNPTLDTLWDACEGGDGEACDELYYSSEVGSEYEEFGDTCGGRREPGTVLCANEDLS